MPEPAGRVSGEKGASPSVSAHTKPITCEFIVPWLPATLKAQKYKPRSSHHPAGYTPGTVANFRKILINFVSL